MASAMDASLWSVVTSRMKLRSHDCDQMQGFFFSKPLPVADCTRALSEGRRLEEAPVTLAA